MHEKEMIFLWGNFEEDKLPPEKQFLKKYFKTKPQRIFLNYYYIFQDKSNFIDHTGIFISKTLIYDLESKYNKLLEVHKESKLNFDLEKLSNIESGKYKLEN
jgi:hypothetical protein